MKNKVRPNQKALSGSIYHAQNESKIKEEKGITLIVLLVTVMILIILTSVVVAQITGDEGIIQSTEVAVDEYDYEQYKEQLQQLAHSIILADSLAGRRTTVTSMAEDMLNETWIKEAVPNEESKDIIVTVDKGYMYQVYYDELTGMLEIEGIGKDDGSSYPTLTAYYDETKGRIEVTASCEGGIARIELIYKGEVVQTANTETASFGVVETGWYKVKAVANNGNERYTNVRVTGRIKAPIIAVTSSGEEENGWYGKDNVAVEVTISVEDEKIVGISYKKNTDEEYTYIEGKNVKLTINTSGRTMIYAYGVTTEGEETSISSLEIKYDNVKPNAGAIAVSPEAPASGWYNTDVVVSLSNATDDTSGIAGYYYWEVTESVADIPQEEKIYVSGETGKITMQSEGEKTIAFQAKDNAGNISGISSITIKKDSIAPDDFAPSITNETATGFTINGTSSDSTSGLAGYYFYVDGVLQNSEISTNGTYQVTGLSANKTYSVYMEAVDSAGNIKKSTSITAKTKGELLAPRISLSGEQGENGYYKGNVTVIIEDSASEDITGTNQIRYQVTGSNQIGETTINGRTATFEITIDGTSTITAQAVSKEGNVSETETKTVNKDSTAPSTATIALSGEAGRTTIDVTASGEDSTSGVASYIFQISTTGNDNAFQSADTVTNTANSCTYQYDELTSDTTYYLRVVVKDKASNTIASNIVNTKTKKSEINFGELTEEEITNNYVGKYIDYTPVSGSFTSERLYNGYGKQEFSTDTSVKWKILFADNDTLTLISDKSVHNGFYLSGYEGYNNGVLLLNNACKAMYSNNTFGAKGRSLKIEDIESVSSYEGTRYTGREFTVSRPSGEASWYPLIFAQEEVGAPNGSYGTLGKSEQNDYLTGAREGNSSYKAKQTWYSYTMSSEYMSQVYVDLFSSSTLNWIASRCVDCLDGVSNYFGFALFQLKDSEVDFGTDYLYTTHEHEDSLSSAIRPVVEIDLTKVNVGVTGTGADGDGYSLTLK